MPAYAASLACEHLIPLRRQLEAESSDGLRLLADPADNPVCSVTLDDSLPAIVVTWKDYATSAQLRFIHEHILHLLKAHGVTKILGDDTALPMITTQDQAWIVQYWMPRAVAAGLRAAATKSPEAYFGELSVSTLRAQAPAALTIRVFDDLDDARRWLRDFE